MSEREEGIERIEWIIGIILNSGLSTFYFEGRKQEKLAEMNSQKMKNLIFLFSKAGEEILKESMHEVLYFHI